jgi:hypothetical protein
MKLTRVVVLVLAFFGAASQVLATNDVTVSAAPGTSSGSINVSGTVSADSSWTPSSSITVTLWQDGCQVTTATITLTSSGCLTWTYNQDVTGLTSGAAYTITGDVTFSSCGQCPQIIRTQPTTSSAK